MVKRKQTKDVTRRASPPPQARTCLLVLGMHRSGTSALTRVLSLMGASLPRYVMGAAKGNEAGHWEPYKLVAYDDGFLKQLDSSWHDWRPLNLVALSLEHRAQVGRDIRALVSADFAGSSLFVLKDPRICRFAQFFMEALEADDCAIAPVIAFRNPLEVCRSLEARTAFWPEGYTVADCALLWLSHVLEAERATRGYRRAIVSYEALLGDWRAAIGVISRQCGVRFQVTAKEAAPLVDDFLKDELRHQKVSAGDVALDPVLGGWVSEAYEALIQLSVDPSARNAQAVLDRIHLQFQRSLPILDNLLSAAHKRLQSAIDAEQRARQESSEQLAAQNQKLNELVENLANAEKSASQSHDEVSRLTTDIQKLSGEHDRQLSDVRSRADHAEHRLHVMRTTELPARDQRIGELTIRLGEVEAALSHHAAELAASREEVGRLVLEGQQRADEYARLDEERKQAVQSLSDERDVLLRARELLGAHPGDNRSLDQLIADRMAQDGQQRDDVERLTASLAEAEAAASALSAEIADRDGRLAQLDHAYAKSERHRLQAETKLEELGKKQIDLDTKSGEMVRLNAKLRVELDGVARKQDELQGLVALREKDVSQLANDAARAWGIVKDAQEFNRNLQMQLDATRRELESVYRSRAWRVFSPWRKFRGALNNIRLSFGSSLGLHPLQQIEPAGEGAAVHAWNMTGDDPQFSLVVPPNGLAPGHYRLSIDMPEGFDGLVGPKLYVDAGRGYNEADAVLLYPMSGLKTRFVAILSLVNGARALRFDPSTRAGRLAIGAIRLRRLTKTQYYLHLARRVSAEHRKRDGSLRPAFRKVISRLKSGGPKAVALAVRTSYQVQHQWPTRPAQCRFVPSLTPDQARYVPRTTEAPLTNTPVRTLAFYLPQFHPIPENDKWWGEGFTEWTNVRPARPQFEGHYQPHEPDALGYYDLRDAEAQRRQIDLAKLYGLGGFCFYFYWFAGKTLLETPTRNYLENKSLDFPFCLCWANENWSRRWDGLDSEVLIGQAHSPEDDIAFIAYLSDYLRDPRYIRIDGRPLVIVYRPNLLPSAAETSERWRRWCRENGIGEIYLAYTQSFEVSDPAIYGFDAAIEFPPNNSGPLDITGTVSPVREDFAGKVYDWRVFPERSRNYSKPAYKLFRSVCPAWDNTPRRRNGGTTFANSSPELFREWLVNAIYDTVERFADKQERLVFVNAWNEWAEGAHLEPDRRHGFAYLQAMRDALRETLATSKSSVLLVTHDSHPHGAQFLLLSMAREYVASGFAVRTLALGGGRLLDDFKAIGPTLDASASTAEETDAFVRRARRSGAVHALCNTVVSGSAIPMLKAQGFQVVSLIHELPGVIRSMRQEENAALVAAKADLVVFAADLVRDGFQQITDVDVNRTLVLPQGLLRRNPWKTRRLEAKQEVLRRHALQAGSKLIVSVAYLDSRKGPDLLVEAARDVLKRHPDAAFIWIGHTDAAMELKVRDRIRELGMEDRFILAGFDPEPLAYYVAADVYALPSREDPFPNVILEAAEAGAPVVAFGGATGAADFLVERGGKLARAFDPTDFADQICALLESRDERVYPPVPAIRKYNLDLLYALAGRPRVSVVVPNYNYAHHIVQRLESIVEQTYPTYEIIVLDDCSSDNSLEVIGDFFGKHPHVDVRVVEGEVNSGSVFRQWKKGLDLCTGDLVWIAEADDFAEPTFLSELAGAFTDPDVKLAYCQSRQVGGGGELLAPDYLDYTKDISDDWQKDYLHEGSYEIASAMAVKNVIPNVSAVLFRRETLERAFSALGDKIYEFRVAGDWLVYMQVLMHGKVFFRSSALNSHRRHAASVTKAGMAEKHYREVEEAQQIAAGLAAVPQATAWTAERYLAHVRAYLGLDERKLSA